MSVSPSGSIDTPSRGRFLGNVATLFGTLAAGTTLATLAPSRAWALPMNALSESEGTTFLAFAQTLYPHATLPSAVYALVVKALDKVATGNPQKAAAMHDGAKALDAATGGSFAAATPDARLAATRQLESAPIFAMVRGTCITALYDNEMAYAHFGYEGASWPKGGYKHRGFNDLTWLPNPPEDASPTLGVLL